MPKSKDVIEMTQIVNNIVNNTDKGSADYMERCNLAVLLLRMYSDLDKTVRRCDESGSRSKWTIRVGAAATAAASAVAGTTLVAGSTGPLPLWSEQ